MTTPSSLPLCRYRYALVVSYIGTKYYGSQRLSSRGGASGLPSIQESIELGLENYFSKKQSRLTAASRTDRGVHALMNMYTLPLMDYKAPTSKILALVNGHLMKNNAEIM